MFLIRQITSAPSQKMSLALQDGTYLTMIIYFMPMQQTWIIRELTYNDFTIYGPRIVVSPNFLHQYKNQIPFGIGCFTNEYREPSLSQDFSSGAFKLYLLSDEETNQYAELLQSSGVS